jgi:hypothetical protein
MPDNRPIYENSEKIVERAPLLWGVCFSRATSRLRSLSDLNPNICADCSKSQPAESAAQTSSCSSLPLPLAAMPMFHSSPTLLARWQRCSPGQLRPMRRFSGRIAQHGRQNRMVEKKKAPTPKRGRRSPLGDRRQFLMMMSPVVIKAVKQAAIEDDRPAWSIMEEAAKQWLDRRKGRRTD